MQVFGEFSKPATQHPQHCLPLIVEDRHLPQVQKMKNHHRKGLQKRHGWIQNSESDLKIMRRHLPLRPHQAHVHEGPI